jgi:hypothetical protein
MLQYIAFRGAESSPLETKVHQRVISATVVTARAASGSADAASKPSMTFAGCLRPGGYPCFNMTMSWGT